MENKRNDENKDYQDIDDFYSKYSHYMHEDDESDNDISSYSESDDEPAEDFNGEYDDINSYSDLEYDDENPEDEYNKKQKNRKNEEGNFFTRRKYRNTKIIALCLVIAILLSGGGVVAYIYYLTNKMDSGNSGIDINNDFDPDSYIEDDNHDFQVMGDVDASSLNGFLYSWANNKGEKMYSKNVINVLLCGVDSTSGNASSGRSDSMILISVNKKTKKITMVSLLRDSWTYIRVPKSDGSTYDYYFKMNAAYNLGGPATLLETIENNFKIEIDQYIAVDFVSFPKLIDSLGGVTVNVKPYESSYIRRTSSQKNFPSGTATLTGKQALIYSRIRHSDGDSDVSRTRRQRTVIKALIASAKKATNGQIVNAFKNVSSYLRTGYTQSEVISLIATAYSHDWMTFEMEELMLPNEDYVDRLSTYVGSQSAWVVDYALCAQKLQKALYGETNIVLSANRTSALSLVSNQRTTGSYSGGSSGSSSSGSSSDSSYNTTSKSTYSYSTTTTTTVTKTTEDNTSENEEKPTEEITEKPVTETTAETNE